MYVELDTHCTDDTNTQFSTNSIYYRRCKDKFMQTVITVQLMFQHVKT